MSDVELIIRAESVSLVYDRAILRQVLRTAANEVRAVAVAMIRGSPGTGQKYYGRFKGRSASSAGSAPRNLDNSLIRSIKVIMFKSGEGVAVRAGAQSANRYPYALALEAGSANYPSGHIRVHRKRVGTPALGYRSAPRPFLSSALQQRMPTLQPRIATALKDAVKMVRVKP